MVSAISTPWVWYLKLKHRLFGLMPLQALVNKYHGTEQERNNDPLWTYWLFLTYDGEVMEAIQNVRERAVRNSANTLSDTEVEAAADKAEEEVYHAISASLREPSNPANHKPSNPANHNVKWKTSLHLLALGVISFLMLGISASNTIALFGYFGKNELSLGAYTTLAMASVFVFSLWAQWMIFRKNVSKMLKALLSWSNGGSDFFETRELEFDKDYKLNFKGKEDPEDPELKGYYKRRIMFVLIGLCTAACALAWASVVHSKLATGLSSDSGFLGLSEGFASELGWAFGVFAGFAAFFLWISGLRTDIKNDEKNAREEKYIEDLRSQIKNDKNNDNKDALNQELENRTTAFEAANKKSTPIGLALLLLLTAYSLTTTMLGQGAIVFETFGEKNSNPLSASNQWRMIGYIAFVAAIVLGRANFTRKAMTKMYENGKLAIEEASLDKVKTEVSEYQSNYIVGSALSLGLVGVLWTSLKNEAWRKPLVTDAINGHDILTPMGIAVLSAVFLWTSFLVAKRVSEGSPEVADKNEAVRERKTLWFSYGAARGSQTPSANAFFASFVNAFSYGAIGGGGAFDFFRNFEWTKSLATYFGYGAQVGSAGISQGTAMQPVTMNKPAPKPKV
jgi:hypothetical protein